MRAPDAHRRSRWALLLLAGLTGCPAPAPPSPDAGPEGVDAGVPVACASPSACKSAGAPGVCRAGLCRADVPCTDDVECGLGERCDKGHCRFTGCVADTECATGKCLATVYACAECGKSADCPRGKPVCDPATYRCLECQSDAECASGGPAYCDPTSGACVYCRASDHCPNGLSCGVDGTCHGAKLNEGCPTGSSCDVGLMCVNLNNVPICSKPCSLYTPDCPANQVCLKLTYAGTNSLVFDKGEPIGMCYPPFSGLKYYREACTRTATTQSCQPNLECVPDTSNSAVCRAFCNPNASGTCPPSELCHPFPGDFSDHRYGLCYADNGYGQECARDAECRPALACAPGDDPSAPGGLATFCHFKVGAAPALAKCAGVAAPDGGTVVPDSVCASGACRGDDPVRPAAFFCYGACHTDADCADAGRPAACDGDFEFTGNGVTAAVKGCRPTCQRAADCADYGPGITCTSQVDVLYYVPKLSQVCGPVRGAAKAGQPCVANDDCRDGYCFRQDGRGAARRGECRSPCATNADCAVDGGLAPDAGATDAGPADAGTGVGAPVCLDVALLGGTGYDGVPGTADDRHIGTRQCAGPSCVSDADCAAPRLCVPEASPAAPLTQLALRCLPPTPLGAKTGGVACATDSECASGACAYLQPPSTGFGRVCFEPCAGSTACPAGTVCHAGGAFIFTPNGSSQSFTACTP